MAGTSYVSATQAAIYNAALDNLFATFARPFSLYVEAQTAVISTDPTYAGPFGQHDQNVFNPTVTPQVYTVTGCITYGRNQDNPYGEPYPGKDASQLKNRDTDGTVRIKVQADGYALMRSCKQVSLDGFNFIMTSAPRPHGLLGAPSRWTFTLTRTE